jgi:hypothetical protein
VSADKSPAVDYLSVMPPIPDPNLALAMKVIADQRKVIDGLEADAGKLREKLASLEAAIVKEYGAHGVLICQYSDPSLPDAERRKAAQAAIAYEKARVSLPQEHQHFILFDKLEAARLARRQAKALPPVVDVTPSPSSDPAA